MSSSYIVQPPGGPKKDDTLILMINDNGVITVDENTLQSLISEFRVHGEGSLALIKAMFEILKMML